PSLLERLGALFTHSVLPMTSADLLGMLASIPGDAHGCPIIWRMKGHYTAMLTVPPLPIFHRECEYALPVKEAGPVLHELREIIPEGDINTTITLSISVM